MPYDIVRCMLLLKHIFLNHDNYDCKLPTAFKPTNGKNIRVRMRSKRNTELVVPATS